MAVAAADLAHVEFSDDRPHRVPAARHLREALALGTAVIEVEYGVVGFTTVDTATGKPLDNDRAAADLVRERRSAPWRRPRPSPATMAVHADHIALGQFRIKRQARRRVVHEPRDLCPLIATDVIELEHHYVGFSTVNAGGRAEMVEGIPRRARPTSLMPSGVGRAASGAILAEAGLAPRLSAVGPEAEAVDGKVEPAARAVPRLGRRRRRRPVGAYAHHGDGRYVIWRAFESAGPETRGTQPDAEFPGDSTERDALGAHGPRSCDNVPRIHNERMFAPRTDGNP